MSLDVFNAKLTSAWWEARNCAAPWVELDQAAHLQWRFLNYTHITDNYCTLVVYPLFMTTACRGRV